MSNLAKKPETELNQVNLLNKYDLNERFESLSLDQRRDRIVEFENELQKLPGSFGEDPFPLKHHYIPGTYIREIFIPAWQILTGKIHKYDHFMVFLSGDCIIYSPEGRERLNQPCVRISKTGAKRVVFTAMDTKIITIHKSDTSDVGAIEADHIAKSFSEVEL